MAALREADRWAPRMLTSERRVQFPADTRLVADRMVAPKAFNNAYRAIWEMFQVALHSVIRLECRL